MFNQPTLPPDAVNLIIDVRASMKMTQAQLAQLAGAGFDQSRVSRIEKGEVTSFADVQTLLDVLAQRGSAEAKAYAEFMRRDWLKLDRPAFRNPQRATLEVADDTLIKIDEFLATARNPALPWPLVRQVERQGDSIRVAASYLQNLSHYLAFIGPIGVGKSTGISFVFGLLGSTALSTSPLERVVLEFGGGNTTLCEVHIRPGPDYGIYIQPQTEAEIRNLVSDYCASLWLKHKEDREDSDAAVSLSEEIQRVIRNMASIAFRRERVAGAPRRQSRDLEAELAKSCASEEELRTKVLERMRLSKRVRTELWFEPTPGRVPLDWMADTYGKINKGLLADVPFPRQIDLLIPDFSRDLAPIQVTVVDTKGVHDIAIRKDLDARLTDSRTLVVLCSFFNDAPGTTAQVLLKHMRESLAERIDDGRIVILALPRPGEALKVKDDGGNRAEDEEEGYELKREQIMRSLGKDGLGGAPIEFFNASSDDPRRVREALFERLSAMRARYADRIVDLAATVDGLIENQEMQAIGAAIEEVAKRLRTFLDGGGDLRARERRAYDEVLPQLDRVHAATLWASTRRSGSYSGFDVYHHLGVGASSDALLRSRQWFADLSAIVKNMKGDEGLSLAGRVLDQIENNIQEWRARFAEAARTAGAEVYREPLKQAAELWSECAGEWGGGSGFRQRVKARLQKWFEEKTALKDKLEQIVKIRWSETVLDELRRLCDEDRGSADDATATVVQFRRDSERLPGVNRAVRRSVNPRPIEARE
jgi:transcriptional regulator with XRE-family HTH domain